MAKIFNYRQGGVDIALRTMRTSEDVFWTERANSYVLVESRDEGRHSMPKWTHNGMRVDCLSINGIGEVRWALTPTDVYKYESLQAGTPELREFPADREMPEVVEHFKLKVSRK